MGFNPDIVVGNWTYRSFLNNPGYIEDVQNLEEFKEQFLFGEGDIEIVESPFGSLAGDIRFGDEYVLDLKGSVGYGNPFNLIFQGVGRSDTQAKGWIYDYVGYLAPAWPNGIDEKQAIVGSVIRTVPHDGRPAGVVASFIAVKKS
jgi:hypothetical protein